MHTQQIHFNAIFRAEPEGGFTVIVPALPGCITYGKNLIEAKKMAIDAIAGYVASLKKHREPVPTDTDTFISPLYLNATKAKISSYA